MNRRTALVVLLVLSLALAGLFAARAAMVAMMWREEGPVATLPIAPWMTPRYIVRAYHLPPSEMRALLDLAPGEGGRLTLEEIAARRGVPVETLIARIEKALPANAPAAREAPSEEDDHRP